jgi:hypothetical protein
MSNNVAVVRNVSVVLGFTAVMNTKIGSRHVKFGRKIDHEHSHALLGK